MDDDDKGVAVIDEIRDFTKKTHESVEGLVTASAEQSTRIEVVEKHLEKQREANKALDEGLKRVQEKVASMTVSLKGVDEEKEEWSWAQCARGVLHGDWGKGFEKSVFDETAKLRAPMASNVDTLGGFLVPVEISDRFIMPTFDKTALGKAGATVLTGLTGPVEIDGLANSAVAYWHDEGQNPTESSVTAVQKKLTPKECSVFIKIQKQLLARSPVAVEARVVEIMRRVLALKLDIAGLTGPGTEYQPRGVVNTPGVQALAMGTNGGIFSVDSVPDIEELLEAQNHDPSEMSMILNYKVKKLLKKSRIAQYSGDTGGLFEISLPRSDQMLRDALGYDFHPTGQLPNDLAKGTSSALTYVLAGVWRNLVMGQFGGIELRASDVASDASGNSAFLKKQRFLVLDTAIDFALEYPESIVMVSDAATTDPVA